MYTRYINQRKGYTVRIKSYLSQVSLGLQGILLLVIDRARQKELDLDYIDEYKNQIAKYRVLTGDAMVSGEVVTINALEAYNQMKAFGLSNDDITDMFRKYAEGRL